MIGIKQRQKIHSNISHCVLGNLLIFAIHICLCSLCDSLTVVILKFFQSITETSKSQCFQNFPPISSVPFVTPTPGFSLASLDWRMTWPVCLSFLPCVQSLGGQRYCRSNLSAILHTSDLVYYKLVDSLINQVIIFHLVKLLCLKENDNKV